MDIKKFLKQTDRPVGRISDWFGVLSLAVTLVGAVSWPASAVTAISQYGWGAVLIFSIIVVCFLMISTALLLFGYRVFKPLPQSQSTLKEKNKEVSELQNSIDNLQKSWKVHAVVFENMRDDLKAHKSVVDTYLRSYEAMLGGTQQQLQNLRENLNNIFLAQRTRKIYDDLSTDIDKLIEYLSDPADKRDRFLTWCDWTSQWKRLESNLRYLTRLVEPYIDARAILFDVPHEKFKSQYWKFNDAAMSEDQKHEYKTFRIIAANYKDLKPKIESELANALYKSM